MGNQEQKQKGKLKQWERKQKEEEGDSGIKMKCNVVMESKKKGKDKYDFTSYTVLKVKKIAGQVSVKSTLRIIRKFRVFFISNLKTLVIFLGFLKLFRRCVGSLAVLHITEAVTPGSNPSSLRENSEDRQCPCWSLCIL